MPNDPTRRAFLGSSLAAGAGVASSGAELPKASLGKHSVSRLILGSNPLYGHSHFNRLYSAHMKEWFTPQRVSELLAVCERAGINTWQLTSDERPMADFRRYRTNGGKMHAIVLAEPQLIERAEGLAAVADAKPAAIVHHGQVTDRRFRAGEMTRVSDFLKRIRDTGTMVGLSTHNPAVIAYVEEHGWDLDFYMASLYRVSRTRDEVLAMAPEAPVGEYFFEGDPHRMLQTVRQTPRPCLVFKLLAAGRLTNTPELVDQAFRSTFEAMKPRDCAIVGMYPRFEPQVEENAARVRRYGIPRG